MTTIKKIKIGEDIKAITNNVDCFYNLTNKNLNTLDNNEMYLMEQHIGYYKPTNKSGIHLLSIKNITEKDIEEMF